MESFVCFLRKVLGPLGHLAVSFIAALGENSKTARALRASERERDEWKTKYLAAKARLQAEQEKSAALWAVIVVLFATVLSCAVFPNRTVLVGMIGLSFALGGLLLPEANRVVEYAKQGLRRTAGVWQAARQKAHEVVLRRTQQMRSRIRDWKWKSIPVARISSTTP
jgi:hypothetical protein